MEHSQVGKHWPWLPRIISSSLWVAMCSVALLTTTLAHAQQPLQLLHQHVRPAITDGRAAPVGYLPADEPLNLVIHLPVRNPQELTSLIDRLSDPASPDYHQWLSVAQFTERFGRTEAEYQKVADFAAGNGFIVTYTSPNRLMLVVRASVARNRKGAECHDADLSASHRKIASSIRRTVSPPSHSMCRCRTSPA